MNNCPDCSTNENAVGEGVRCVPHEVQFLRAENAALQALVKELEKNSVIGAEQYQREAQLACDMRNGQDFLIERCAKTIEAQWPDAAKLLRQHPDGICGEDYGELQREIARLTADLARVTGERDQARDLEKNIQRQIQIIDGLQADLARVTGELAGVKEDKAELLRQLHRRLTELDAEREKNSALTKERDWFKGKLKLMDDVADLSASALSAERARAKGMEAVVDAAHILRIGFPCGREWTPQEIALADAVRELNLSSLSPSPAKEPMWCGRNPCSWEEVCPKCRADYEAAKTPPAVEKPCGCGVHIGEDGSVAPRENK